MGLIGLAKGIIKVATGVAEGDSEQIIKGLVKTGVNVVVIFKGGLGDEDGDDDED